MKLDRIFFELPGDQVRRLLVGVARQLEEGFTVEESEQFCANLVTLGDGEDLLIEPIVLFQGHPSPFVVNAFKQGSENYELVFIVPEVLAELVTVVAGDACGQVPVRILPSEAEGED